MHAGVYVRVAGQAYATYVLVQAYTMQQVLHWRCCEAELAGVYIICMCVHLSLNVHVFCLQADGIHITLPNQPPLTLPPCINVAHSVHLHTCSTLDIIVNMLIKEERF